MRKKRAHHRFKGIIPWRDGQEPAEVAIRKVRDDLQALLCYNNQDRQLTNILGVYCPEPPHPALDQPGEIVFRLDYPRKKW